MSPRRLLLVLLAGSTLACAGGTSVDATKDPARDPVVSVTLGDATARPMPTVLPLTGALVASNQAHVAADASGTITSVNVERGEKVSRGQVIAVVDTRISRLSSVASDAQVNLAAAQLGAAEDECTRAEALFAGGAISKAQYDRTLSTCSAQKRALDAAKAQAQIAGTTLSKAQIRAPFAGTVGERLVDVGEFVGPSQPVVTLYTDGALRVRFSVPQKNVTDVREGQKVRFRTAGQDDGWHDGVVRFLSAALREQTRDLVVEAEVTDPTGLRPGMFAEVALELDAAPAVVVPDAAVLTDGSVHTVFVARDGRVFKSIVDVGESRDGFTVIRTDVAAGDKVVLSPAANLRDGSRVE
jgi:RND family efflux transporter MFP subunit